MHSIRSKLRERLALELSGKVLDCGSGDDLFGQCLRRPGNKVISLDVDVDALRRTPGIRVVASCAEMPFVDDFFDAVWACAIIEHVREDVLAEMVRVTRVGGRIVAVTPNHHSIWDCLKRLLGMDSWSEMEGHVRLYGFEELSFFGRVQGETWFVPWMGWLFRRWPRLGHVWILDVQVTDELKARCARRFERPEVGRCLAARICL